MKVKLKKRWGTHRRGETVEVDAQRAERLRIDGFLTKKQPREEGATDA